MNWQISVQEFFTKNQNITCELDKLMKLNDEELINLSKTENLVTIMTCNEVFNKDRPDTFFEIVK